MPRHVARVRYDDAQRDAFQRHVVPLFRIFARAWRVPRGRASLSRRRGCQPDARPACSRMAHRARTLRLGAQRCVTSRARKLLPALTPQPAQRSRLCGELAARPRLARRARFARRRGGCASAGGAPLCAGPAAAQPLGYSGTGRVARSCSLMRCCTRCLTRLLARAAHARSWCLTRRRCPGRSSTRRCLMPTASKRLCPVRSWRIRCSLAAS